MVDYFVNNEKYIAELNEIPVSMEIFAAFAHALTAEFEVPHDDLKDAIGRFTLRWLAEYEPDYSPEKASAYMARFFAFYRTMGSLPTDLAWASGCDGARAISPAAIKAAAITPLVPALGVIDMAFDMELYSANARRLILEAADRDSGGVA